MDKKQDSRPLEDNALDLVHGGAKSLVEVDDTKMASGSMTLEIEGETVILVNDGDHGFRCTVNGKEYRFTDAEIAQMLKEQLQNS